jgi:hypothetical protein
MTRKLLPLGGVAAAGIMLAAASARADDMWMSSGLDMSLALFKLGIAIVVLAAYILITIGVEAWLFSLVLELRFWRAFGYAVLVNMVSGGVGALWWALGGQVGWKTAVLEQKWLLAGMHIVRSFLVTLAIEAFILVPALHGRADTRKTLKAAVWANAASYVLIFFVLILASAMWPETKA